MLVGVLRQHHEAEHLAWIRQSRRYYSPLSRTRTRQLEAKWVAIYSPTALRHPGAVTHRAAVIGIDVVRRGEIATPWPSRQTADSLQVVYRLGDVEAMPRPILNQDGSDRWERVSTHRWASRLSLERASTLDELFIETEPEWRLYEELRVCGAAFRLRPGPARSLDADAPAGRAWFLTEGGSRARFAGPSGFLVRLPGGGQRYLARPEDVAALLA